MERTGNCSIQKGKSEGTLGKGGMTTEANSISDLGLESIEEATVSRSAIRSLEK